MTLPTLGPATNVHLLTKDLATSHRIGKFLGIGEEEIIHIAANYKQFVRGKGRTLYVCGEGGGRRDFQEILHYARSLGWTVVNGLPPSRKVPS